uniref:Putative phytosulfokine receptor n=1 Tax=Phyllostachys edulis TaxID=38705 RepID=D3IVQ5_PHYED|nr:putative phytosulfokine receptor [Phyllostachys edulis]
MALLTIAPYPTTACTLQEELSLLEFLADAEPAPDAGGSLAASWLNGTDCCRWEGITCGRNETVTHVSLSSKGLQGRISPSLGNLTGLLHVNLSCNSLTGSLPVELLYSGSIVVIDVSFNRLSGVLREIPSSTTKFRSLQVLNISWNFFRGHLPCTAWEVMNNLVELRARHNSFTGQIPASFCAGSPSHFAVLDLSYNQFSGGIPAGLGNCSMLRVLRAGHNNLSGTIPHELFSASALEYLAFPGNGLQGKLNGANIVKLANLTVLDLGKNGLTGEIPDSIGQLKRLEELHLDHNSMSGELPPALGNCSNLKLINLRGNSFSGELAKVNFSTLSNLRALDLFSNSFTGTIPGSIYSCSIIVALRLSSNNFQGQLSPRIRNLKSLSFLSLANNSFTHIMGTLRILKSFKYLSTLIIGSNFKGETIPEDQAIDGFEKLRILLMDNCQTSGEIPHWIENLTKLEILDLSNNRLIGLIPAWIKRLHLLYSGLIKQQPYWGYTNSLDGYANATLKKD